ncbi:MAG: flagellar biosynthesis protein FliQ [Treponema sp.]|jgi:flagellar biosynthetic protein FliQ|nr:flagellar biosynthesis protein FliQ [Treponema sp.]
MSIGELTALLRQGVMQVMFMAGPMLISALLIGLIVSILQAASSIQEQTLTFVPKMFVILLVLMIFGGWMFTSLGQFTEQLFRRIPEMAR